MRRWAAIQDALDGQPQGELTQETGKMPIIADRTRNKIGARRWIVEWYVLPGGSIVTGEFDKILDNLQHKTASFSFRQAAVARAQEAVKEDFYGSVVVKEQKVEWLDKSNNVASWEDIGSADYIEG